MSAITAMIPSVASLGKPVQPPATESAPLADKAATHAAQGAGAIQGELTPENRVNQTAEPESARQDRWKITPSQQQVDRAREVFMSSLAGLPRLLHTGPKVMDEARVTKTPYADVLIVLRNS